MKIRPISLLLAVLSAALALGQPRALTILYTNDMHASFTPHEATWVKQTPRPMVGGFKELAFAVDSIRKTKPNVLLLDAGDLMTGNPISDIEFHGAQGGALIEMMNRIGYDAWCPGNHDFDISQENLRSLIGLAKFPVISANIVNPQGESPINTRQFAVLERGGLKIVVIGVMSQELYSLVNQNNLVGVRVLSPVQTTQRLIDHCRTQTDLLIALTHQGLEADSVLAANTQGLHVIVGGHSHTRLRTPKIVNNVLIVQAGSNCENLGVLDLTVDQARVTSSEGKLIQLWPGEGRPHSIISGLVDSMRGMVDRQYSEVIGTLKEDWRKGDGESNVGNFVTDAQREAAGAEVAFTNSGGIRTNVAAGPLTRRALFEVLPFRNVLTTFQLSGSQLRSIMLYYAAARPAVQTSGIACRWVRRDSMHIEIQSITINGRPLDDSRSYTCAASDFFVGEAKRYLGIEIVQPVFLSQTVFEVVEKAVRKVGVVSSRIEGRIAEVKR